MLRSAIFRSLIVPVLLLPLSNGLRAQPALTLSSASTIPGGTVTLNLSLSSSASNPPAAIQWTLTYPTNAISALSVAAGPALTSASVGKTITCAGGASGYNCIASGLNANIISDGVIATITLTLSGGIAAAVGVINALAASPAGSEIAMTSAGGSVNVLPAVSSVSCTPATLTPGASSTCTVTITASGGASVNLTSSSGDLAVPVSVSVPATSSSATFAATAQQFTSNESVTITATLNGSSQSATLSLTVPSVVNSIACSPSGLMSGAQSACAVTLSNAAPAATTIAIHSNSGLITAPSSIVVPTGSITQTFTAAAGSITADTTATITVTLGASSQSANVALWSTPTLSSITCAVSKVPVGSGTSCTVTVSKPAGPIAVSLASNNSAIAVPASTTVPQGSTTASFPLTAQSLSSNWVVVSASYNGVTKGVVVMTSAAVQTDSTAAITAIACKPKVLEVGSSGLCRVTLSGGASSTAAEIELAASTGAIHLPAQIFTRPRQSVVEFQVESVDTPTDAAVITAWMGEDKVTDTIAVSVGGARQIRVPGDQFARYGTELRFHVSALDPSWVLSAADLPAGAAFDAEEGEFRWTPAAAQAGSHRIDFTATDGSGRQATAAVGAQVDYGEPLVTRVVNAASRSSEAICSPGAIASIQGRWFTDAPAASDPSGASQEISGVRILVNGSGAPILSASATELTFLCPDLTAGADLQVVVQTDHGSTAPVHIAEQSAAPAIFSVDGSGHGQGAVVLDGGDKLAMVRNYRFEGQPAAPGDHVTIYATGLDGIENIELQLGEARVAANAVVEMPGHPGVFQVTITIPDSAKAANDLPLSLTGSTSEGRKVNSNIVSIAVEGNNR
jgi:uncharacterized protein (TIGR03437 family)